MAIDRHTVKIYLIGELGMIMQIRQLGERFADVKLAFAEELEHSKILGLSGKKSYSVSLLEFYLNDFNQLCRYDYPTSEDWISAYADGSFHLIHLQNFIKNNFRFFSIDQMMEIYRDYKKQGIERTLTSK